MLLTPTTPNIDKLYFDKVRSFPAELYSKLYTPEVTGVITNAMVVANVPKSSRVNINLAVMQVFTGDVPPRELHKLIAQWCPLDEKQAYTIAQLITEQLVNKHREYLVNTFGPSYFSPDPSAPAKKPADTTPKLDGNVVNLKGS